MKNRYKIMIGLSILILIAAIVFSAIIMIQFQKSSPEVDDNTKTGTTNTVNNKVDNVKTDAEKAKEIEDKIAADQKIAEMRLSYEVLRQKYLDAGDYDGVFNMDAEIYRLDHTYESDVIIVGDGSGALNESNSGN